MMDMLSSGVMLILLAVVSTLVAVGYVLFRVAGARQARGDHPGEKGYDPAQHEPRGPVH